MFFTLMIAQGSSVYISMEKKTIKVMKVMPIPFKKQIIIKALIPFVLSVMALIITTLVLRIFNLITWSLYLMMIVLSISLLLVFTLISLYEELSIKHKKQKNTILTSLICYILPIAFGAFSMFFSFKGLSLSLSFLITFAFYFLLLVPIFFFLKGHLNNLFLDLDMVN